MTQTQPTAAMPQLSGVTHRWIDIRGIRMHVAEAGSGDPLILLHGFPQNWWEWHAVIPRMAEHFHVIAVDQRGFGWTDAPPGGYDARTLMDDVVGLMEQLNIPRARFLTHDWGSLVAQFLAMERPDLVQSLVITGTPDVHIRPNARLIPLFPKLWHAFALAIPVVGPRIQRNRRFMRHLFTAFEPAGALTGEDVELYGNALAQPARARAGSALYRRSLIPAFMGIIFGGYARRDFTTPTLALIGAMEPSAALQEMGHHPGRGNNITAEILPGEGHFLPDHCPDVVSHKALRFFESAG
ncbi:alpha/beta hydrolase [Pseudarthrobacter sp. J75]|uniref:alpha/beta fold hydrolase n=1 Tax=unclassified Pseudarthrobacter TaxID=2647000 RepID=UPI002E7FD30D|nr:MULTISPECIES: alpha/beta hydrolase [unclassified Pseudarthrobacter]MEE2522514.1 alpha/beta hydrolase [Pseudarthrobacter sp. J47]MEE2529142.1 alpha/beta hydrolase [Pseudarthrobacter sp. J75]